MLHFVKYKYEAKITRPHGLAQQLLIQGKFV